MVLGVVRARKCDTTSTLKERRAVVNGIGPDGEKVPRRSRELDARSKFKHPLQKESHTSMEIRHTTSCLRVATAM